MPKILYLVSTLKQSGTTIQLYYIAKYMTPGTFDLYAITLSPEEEGSMLERFREVGVNVQSLDLTRLSGFINGKTRLLKMIGQIQPDVIHTQGFRSDGYSLALADSYPVVSSMQTYPFYDYPMFYGRIRGYLMARKHLAVIRKRENFIACSKSVADNFRKYNKVHIAAIQNGVDTEVFHPVTLEVKNALRETLNIPKIKKIFISVGVLIPRKDMRTVIRGFQQSRNDDALLLIAGGGYLHDDLLKLSSGDDQIIILGDCKNIPELMQASDYFISASWAEGLPNTVLEAMACGLPVILSDIAPHLEVFEEADDYPYFFDIGNDKQLSGLINDILLKDYDDLTARMQEVINNTFTARIMSGQYQELYHKLILGSTRKNL